MEELPMKLLWSLVESHILGSFGIGINLQE